MNLQTFIANRMDDQWSNVQTDPELVRDIQCQLNRLGFNPGAADGVWSNQTQQALVRFKEANDVLDHDFTITVARSLLQSAPASQRQLVTIGSHSSTPSSPKMLSRPVPPPPPSRMANHRFTNSMQPVVRVPAPGMRRINAQGLDIIKKFERLRLEADRCPAGIMTVGYGSTLQVNIGHKITPKQAEALLLKDLERFEIAVKNTVEVPLNHNQFSALVSLAFNIGGAAFASSTLLKRLNQGDYQGAAEEFLRWDRAGGKALPRLTQRRQAEKALFLQP